jgi:hypothetical protein
MHPPDDAIRHCVGFPLEGIAGRSRRELRLNDRRMLDGLTRTSFRLLLWGNREQRGREVTRRARIASRRGDVRRRREL